MRQYRPQSRYKHVVTRTVVDELQFVRLGRRNQGLERQSRILNKPSLEQQRIRQRASQVIRDLEHICSVDEHGPSE